jgi:hypothetical protein
MIAGFYFNSARALDEHHGRIPSPCHECYAKKERYGSPQSVREEATYRKVPDVSASAVPIDPVAGTTRLQAFNMAVKSSANQKSIVWKTVPIRSLVDVNLVPL